MKKKVILLGLNEINIDFVKQYCALGHLPNLKQLIDKGVTKTTSEAEYRLFEPWIQWVTIHTGKNYAEHGVFRLGDIVERKDIPQIFETLEAEGYIVAAVSPFNVDNRLKKSPFFVPDPWTKTPASGSPLLKKLSAALQQMVNDNAQSKMTVSSAKTIITGLLKYVPPTRYSSYFKLMKKIMKPGARALILDNLLADVFVYQWKRFQPDFSSLFLNAGAHIQHHFLFNSILYKGEFKNPEWYCPAGFDPLLMALQQYDKIIERVQKLGTTIYLATGLSQRPHEHLTYYWRLKNHQSFVEKIGLSDYEEILPRMSRDFLITFKSEAAAEKGARLLESFYMKNDGIKVFEPDNRGKSLFVELIYPNELTDDAVITNGEITIPRFKEYLAFVAIKNGEHDGTGYLISNNGLKAGTIPLTEVYSIIKHSCEGKDIPVTQVTAASAHV